MLRDDNSDISFIFKVRVMPTQEEKYGTDIKYAAPKVVNGESHVVALKTNGTVWTWGRGTNNQLGDGSNSNDNYPLQVLGVNGSGFLEKIVDIAAGTNFSVALDADGNVYTWGYNSDSYPVLKLTDAVAVGAANSMVYAVMNDRTVKYWSYGSSPTSLIKGESASTSDLFENALEVTGGISHNTILRDDGYVWTWSNGGAEAGNASGQLGNTLRKYLNYPALVVVGESPYNSVYLNNVVEVRSGANHNVALIKEQNENHTQYDVPTDKAFTSKNGYVFAWGDNSEGQFGKTTAQSNSYAPVRVDIPDDEVINHISAEKNSNLATTADNTVWAWGNYADGQMGANGTSSAPVQIVSNDGGVWSSSNGIKGALNGAAGGDSMSAYISDGTVWTWGSNSSGQLGDQTNVNKNYPVQAITEPATKMIKVAHAYVYKKSDLTTPVKELEYPNEIMIDVDETVVIDRIVVEEVLAFNLYFDKRVTEISVDNIDAKSTDEEAIEVTSTNSTVKAESPENAVAGDSAYVTMSVPYDGDTATGFIRVGLIADGTTSLPEASLSTTSSAIVNADGTVSAWGDNSFDKLNVSLFDNQSDVYAPGVVMKDNDGQVVFNNVKEFASGENFSVILTNDGEVYAWGTNENSQTGIGNAGSTAYAYPQRVMNSSDTPLSDIISIKAYSTHAVALSKDGRVYVWGAVSDKIGQNRSRQNYYAKPLRITNVQAIAAGENHTVALKADGSVWTWGSNDSGQLGSDTSSTPLPVMAEGVSSVVAIAAGADTSIALTADGSVYTWGGGENTATKVLDNATQVDAKGEQFTAVSVDGSAYAWNKNETPTKVDGLSNVITSAAGGNHAMAVLSDGNVYTWGENSNYQLGDGTNNTSTSPIKGK